MSELDDDEEEFFGEILCRFRSAVITSSFDYSASYDKPDPDIKRGCGEGATEEEAEERRSELYETTRVEEIDVRRRRTFESSRSSLPPYYFSYDDWWDGKKAEGGWEARRTEIFGRD